MSQPVPDPPPRARTVRNALRHELSRGSATLGELSKCISVAEKQLIAHLEHLARSLAAEGRKLTIEPARCLACGYVFIERARLTKPSRCPSCRRTRISHPRFLITDPSP